MCVRCFDQTTDELIEETGVSQQGMDMVDDLTIAAMNLGTTMANGGTVRSDPLRPHKEQLATYISRLEAAALARGMDLDDIAPGPLVVPGVMPPAPGISS